MPRTIVAFAAALGASLLAAGAARADCPAQQLACRNTCGQSPAFRVGGPLAGDVARRCQFDCATSYRTCRASAGAERPPSDQERAEAERRGRAMKATAEGAPAATGSGGPGDTSKGPRP
jgi:hypothetical protein